MPQLIDIHAHIQFPAFARDADEVIARAKDAGVKMVAPSSQMTTARRGIAFAEKYPEDIWAAVGLHPLYVKTNHFEEDEWKPLIWHARTVAVGETGLDYVDRLSVTEADRERQEELYRTHIEMALAAGKPVIQHCRSGPVDGIERDAHEDALRIVAEYVPKGLRGVAHCYSGNLKQARQYLDLGFSLSFTGLITFNHSWDDVIRETPLDRLMVETDIPYMTPRTTRGSGRPRTAAEAGSRVGMPVPRPGQRNEPIFVWLVAERIAALKGIPFDVVAEQTTENARKLFRLQWSGS